MKTFGWDTVFVVKAERINALLRANSGGTVLQFDTPLPGLPGAQATGSFEPWQLADGGSNDIVHLKLTIAAGTLNDGTTSYNLAGLTLVIATYLKWLEYGAAEENLAFGYDRLGEMGKPPNRGELAVIALQDPNHVLPEDRNALLAYALGTYLVAHAADVRFVFATVNLIPPATNSWLAPKKSAYGYFRREGGADSYLTILSVTTDRDIAALQRTVDPTALPGATNASFIISDELYLTKIIAPSLGATMNADAGAFFFDAKDGVLRNNRKLWTKKVRSGAIDYAPWVDSLEVRSGENALQGRYAGGVDLKAGISMTYTIAAANQARYDTALGALQFAADPSPKESHNADIPWYWWFLGPIVVAITAIVVAIISKDIANQISNDNRERLALGRYPPSSILWGGNNKLAVTSMGVNGAMYVYGNV